MYFVVPLVKSLLKPFRDGRPLPLAFLLLLITVGTFLPVLRNGFINYDDPTYIYRNPHVLSGLTWDNIRWAFTTLQAGFWHPLTWLSIMTDCQLFGQAAWGHHLTSLILHTANALLLFFFLARSTSSGSRDRKSVVSGQWSVVSSQSVWPAFFVAAFFAIHPLHVESVAWAAERKDVLSTFFFLLTLIAYARYVEVSSVKCQASGAGEIQSSKSKVQSPKSILLREGFGGQEVHGPQSVVSGQLSVVSSPFRGSPLFWFLTALALFALGLMSKTMLVTVPFVLLLLDFWPFRRVSGVNRVSGAKCQVSRAEGPGAPAHPLTRSLAHPLTRSPTHSALRIFVEKLPFLALSLAAGIITIIAQKQAGALQTGARFSTLYRIENVVHSYAGYLFQTIWPTRLAVFYSYPKSFSLPLTIALAFIGLLLTVAALWSLCSSRREEAFMERPVTSNQCSVSSSQPSRITDHCSLITDYWSLITDYRSLITGPLSLGWLWYIITLLPVIGIVQVGAQSHADRYTYIPLIGIFIAVVWAISQRVTYQVSSVTSQTAISTRDQKPQKTAAEVQHMTPDTWHLTHILQHMTPDTWHVTLLFASLIACAVLSHHQLAHWRDTESILRHAIAVTPDNALAHQNLGVELGQQAGSLRLRLLKTSDPAEQKLLRDRISALEEQAISELQRAVQSDPDYALAQGNLGQSLLRKGRIEQSIYHSEQAVRLLPNFAGAHRNLGIALGMAGRVDDAIDHLQRAVALAPTDLSARENLAYAFLAKGRTNDANVQLAEAARIRNSSR